MKGEIRKIVDNLIVRLSNEGYIQPQEFHEFSCFDGEIVLVSGLHDKPDEVLSIANQFIPHDEDVAKLENLLQKA